MEISLIVVLVLIGFGVIFIWGSSLIEIKEPFYTIGGVCILIGCILGMSSLICGCHPDCYF